MDECNILSKKRILEARSSTADRLRWEEPGSLEDLKPTGPLGQHASRRALQFDDQREERHGQWLQGIDPVP
jgi:hypothetical protein